MMLGRASTPLRDATLVAVSTAAIVIANWPADSPRRLITFRHAAGTDTSSGVVGFRTHSLPVDDPRLRRLQRHVERRSNPQPGMSVAVARWRLELAEFYAANPPRSSSNAGDVSDGADPSKAGEDANGSDGANGSGGGIAWDRFAFETRETLERLDREMAAKIEAAGAGPIRFGTILPPSPPRTAIPIAVLAAAFAFFAARFWGSRFPGLSLEPAPQASGGPDPDPGRPPHPRQSSLDRIDVEADQTLALAIPRHWVRVRQPLGVQLRRVCFVAIVVAALASSFLGDRLQLSLGI